MIGGGVHWCPFVAQLAALPQAREIRAIDRADAVICLDSILGAAHCV